MSLDFSRQDSQKKDKSPRAEKKEEKGRKSSRKDHALEIDTSKKKTEEGDEVRRHSSRKEKDEHHSGDLSPSSVKKIHLGGLSPKNSVKKEREKEKEKEDHDPLPAPWKLENFSEEKRQKIKAFREGAAAEYIKPEQNDLDIARWLVARKWNIEAATKMFVDSMIWRKEENIDTIMEWAPKMLSFKLLTEYWPSTITKDPTIKFRTRDGYQVVYERLTAVSPRILESISLQELKYFHIYQQELASLERIRISKEEKNDLTYASTVYVQDLCDLTMSHLTKQNFHMMNTFTDIDSLNYPETVRKVYIINAPSAWAFGWKVSKNFLDPNTIEKVAILDSDFAPVLSLAIAPTSLPIDYGGELDYKVTGGGSMKEIKAKMTKLDVTAELSITVNVEKGTQIVWRYRLKNDITFVLYYQSAKDGKKEAITEPKKEDSDNCIIEGQKIVEKDGFYTLTWDNTGNWTKRSLSYIIFINGVILDEKEAVNVYKK